MSTQTINSYAVKKINNANAHKQLKIAKSLNRPVIMLRRGITGDMHYNQTSTPSIRNLTLMQKAKESRAEAKKLFESGLSNAEISKKMRKSRNTINNYFKALTIENGEEWGKKIKEKRG